MVCPQQRPLRAACSLSNLSMPKSQAPTGHRRGRAPGTSGKMRLAINSSTDCRHHHCLWSRRVPVDSPIVSFWVTPVFTETLAQAFELDLTVNEDKVHNVLQRW